MANTIKINKQSLVDALLEENRTGGSLTSYAVAIDHSDEAPEGRVIICDTPSNLGGYFANNVGETNYDCSEFVDGDNADLTWCDYGEIRYDYDIDDDEEIPAHIMQELRQAASEWVDVNLLDSVWLDGGEDFFDIEYI